jgi:hypothetical protein
MNQQQMTTDAPRTDAAKVDKCGMTFVSLEFAQELERELNASQAEVAKLNHQLLKTESDLIQSQDINSFLDTEFRIACKRADKAEAEAIQLKAQLNQALAIATGAHEEIGRFFRGDDYTRIGMEIYELKLTIK